MAEAQFKYQLRKQMNRSTYNDTLTINLPSGVAYKQVRGIDVKRPDGNIVQPSEKEKFRLLPTENAEANSVNVQVSSPVFTGMESHPDGGTYYHFYYDIYIIYDSNTAPNLTLSTTDARTLYENDTINISGTVQDKNDGNVMMVKYQINSGTTRTIHTSVSDGSEVPFNRILTFRNKRLYDGQTAVTGDLQEGAQNTIQVWAEDDQGGRSPGVLRSFQVVPNRPASLTINQVQKQENLIDSDAITVSGSAIDPDGNTVTVEYRLFGETFEQVYNGAGGDFSFNVQLSRLKTGDNSITIRATDSYGATTTRSLKVTKSGAVIPLKRSVATYRINPTNGTAQGVLLWVQRDSGDLNVTLEISATAEGEAENWQPMTLDSTAFVEDGIEEDEWTFEADAPKEKILFRMTLERENTNSTAGVRLISGVLS